MFKCKNILAAVGITLLFSILLNFFIVTHAQQLSEGSPCSVKDGRQGYCAEATKCNWWIKRARHFNNPDESYSCGQKDTAQLFCCPLDERSAPRKVSDVATGFVERACQRYDTTWRSITGRDGFNIKFDPRITNGEPADSDEAPFAVALGYPKSKQELYSYTYKCGGTLITGYHVLTAAHCVRTLDHIIPKVVLHGSVSLVKDVKESNLADIRRMVVHPSYTGAEKYFDIAILTLYTTIVFSSKSMPICLPTKPISHYESLTGSIFTTGWGEKLDGEMSDDLLKTRRLTLVDKKNCTVQYKHVSGVPDGIDDSLICAVDPIAVKQSDACQGDSGGPLYVKSGDRTYLLGVVSFGQGCSLASAGVYQSVYFYLDWINANVWSGPEGGWVNSNFDGIK